jgi:putative flippase GtrA
MTGKILRFGAIGALATMVHLLIGTMLIQSGRAPLTANGIAFATAFMVSFLGHLSFSFADHQADPLAALWRFGCVALTGFGINQVILSGLLHLSDLPPPPSWPRPVPSSAALSFVFSRQWAFRPASAARL